MKWNRLLLLYLLTATLGAACSQESDPWAETELSRDVRARRDSPTFPPTLDLGDIDRHFGLFGSKPNLYDLHHPEGALAVGQQEDGRLALEILKAAGLPGRIDKATGITYYDGEIRCLWLNRDKTRLILPSVRSREGLPMEVGTISITRHGQMRVSAGEEMSVPIAPGDIRTFAASWASARGAPGPWAPRSEKTHRQILVEVNLDAYLFDDQPIAPESLREYVTQALAADPNLGVRLRPSAQAPYGHVVAALDQLIRAGSPDLRFAFPNRPMRRLGLEDTSAPVLALKADALASFAKIDEILTALATQVDRVVLLTTLDVSDPSLVTPDTYPGGLPGGLFVPLAPVEGSGARISSRPRPPSGTSPDTDEILYVGGTVKPPAKIHAPQPEYTDLARKARIQGVVIVQVVIDKSGAVTRTKILKGLRMGLDEKAIEAISRWKFEPATLDGQPVSVYYNLRVSFRLE